MAIHAPYAAAAMLALATAFLVGVFYSLEALQGERRDRSILFWKSLPVSDRTTVLSKASIPLVVLPLLVFVISAVLILIMVLVGTAVLLPGNRSDIGIMWANVEPFQSILAVLYTSIVVALWYAPIYGWLLLVSGSVRRTALLWSALPLVAIVGIEKIVFNTTTRSLSLLQGLAIGWIDASLSVERGNRSARGARSREVPQHAEPLDRARVHGSVSGCGRAPSPQPGAGLMEALLPFHIVAGVIGLVSGAAALSAAKGATLHRGSGKVFVYAMVAMASSGAAMALWDGPDANAIGGLTAAYLVITALTTVRPVTPASRRLDLGATALGLAIGLTSLVLAFVSLTTGSGIDGVAMPLSR